ncbi:MAG: hypothetical protein EVA45_00075 [Flavobacteriales bacterium]|nr:hypothetical protein [Flavobacteriaceae bacterium]RZP00922.1 MAG: hypothetical protein EVA45_00075 [Flavobacteriales bacterium]|tara:strand:- start:82 stop:492 length:411 start_codon:yes stop_codon:yes gene_type:complete
MIYKVFRYVSFFVSSIDQYSVHSPIVFKLLIECIYKLDKKLILKDLSILEKSIRDIYLDEFEVNYIDNILSINISEFALKGDRIIIIKNIRKKNEYYLWKKIILDNKIKVSLDFYYFGLIINKSKNLQKQDYQIRL